MSRTLYGGRTALEDRGLVLARASLAGPAHVPKPQPTLLHILTSGIHKGWADVLCELSVTEGLRTAQQAMVVSEFGPQA